MKKQTKELTEEKISQLFCAVNEKNITKESLAEELEPLIKDYFIVNAARQANCIELSFLNGQKFKLTATAVN